jgi:hypothetical protein
MKRGLAAGLAASAAMKRGLAATAPGSVAPGLPGRRVARPLQRAHGGRRSAGVGLHLNHGLGRASQSRRTDSDGFFGMFYYYFGIEVIAMMELHPVLFRFYTEIIIISV